MKVYGSGGWVSAGSTVNGTSQRKTYAVGTSEGTYTGSTTVFPIHMTAGFIDVYLNGIKLDPDNDFTATNGTSVTLSLPQPQPISWTWLHTVRSNSPTSVLVTLTM